MNEAILTSKKTILLQRLQASLPKNVICDDCHVYDT